jgi:hypothetical protein
MAAVIIRDNAKATWLAGLAGVRSKAYDMGRRAMACAARHDPDRRCRRGPGPAGGRAARLPCSDRGHRDDADGRGPAHFAAPPPARRPGTGLALGTRIACSDKPAST